MDRYDDVVGCRGWREPARQARLKVAVDVHFCSRDGDEVYLGLAVELGRPRADLLQR